ncbi:hypothetical protein BLNAU_9047 [Blattamonas nauphoetae]|uniref:Uncharacterized protein n=1 Tax=Blattamonas nauphoetae TaxID=2049346 RepID=A0ABQ9XX62_9EUKA|nr:hypothetical protein BLNAU_9047 [Blattamonas nauphoetae]
MAEVDFFSSQQSVPCKTDTLPGLISLLKDSNDEESIRYVRRIAAHLHKHKPFIPHYQVVQLTDLLADCAHPSNEFELVTEASSLLTSLPLLCPVPNITPPCLKPHEAENADADPPTQPNALNDPTTISAEDLSLPLNCGNHLLLPPIPITPPTISSRLGSANSSHRGSLPDYNRASLGSLALSNTESTLSSLSLYMGELLPGLPNCENEHKQCRPSTAFSSPILTRSEYVSEQQKLFSSFQAPPPTPNLGSHVWPIPISAARPHSTSVLDGRRRRHSPRNASPSPGLGNGSVNLPFHVPNTFGVETENSNPSDDDE